MNFAEGLLEVAVRYLKVAEGLLNFAEGFLEVAGRYLKVAEGLLNFAEGFLKVAVRCLKLAVVLFIIIYSVSNIFFSSAWNFILFMIFSCP